MDKERFRRKYLLGIFTSPLTLFPILGGVTGFLRLNIMDKTASSVYKLIWGVGF